jgi:hypothetical protein
VFGWHACSGPWKTACTAVGNPSSRVVVVAAAAALGTIRMPPAADTLVATTAGAYATLYAPTAQLQPPPSRPLAFLFVTSLAVCQRGAECIALADTGASALPQRRRGTRDAASRVTAGRLDVRGLAGLRLPG